MKPEYCLNISIFIVLQSHHEVFFILLLKNEEEFLLATFIVMLYFVACICITYAFEEDHDPMDVNVLVHIVCCPRRGAI